MTYRNALADVLDAIDELYAEVEVAPDAINTKEECFDAGYLFALEQLEEIIQELML